MKNFYFKIGQNIQYPNFPYSPDQPYLELTAVKEKYNSDNFLYKAIRELFIQAGYDKRNIGTEIWNPFRGLIENNQLVVIKPNLVIEEKKKLIGSNCITSHASIIRPIIDYLYQLQKTEDINFEIVIGDVPLQSANFDKIIEQNGLKALVDYFKSKYFLNVSLLDLRNEIAQVSTNGYVIRTLDIANDPLGYTNVCLENSFLDDIIKDSKKFSIGSYNDKETYKRHSKLNKHYYHISNTVLESDLFINIPKLKTHQKSGITVALKNLIGINGDKSWIPHYRKGSPKFNGDEFSDHKYLIKYLNRKINKILYGRSETIWKFSKSINKRLIKPIFFKQQEHVGLSADSKNTRKKYIMSGAWFGNDTLWRPILDLNKLLIYSDKTGHIIEKPQRRYISITDGVIAAEGNGPIDPIPKKLGFLSITENPVLNDLCCATIMGFDWQKIPQLKQSTKLNKYFHFNGNIDEIRVFGSVNNDNYELFKYEELPVYPFLPPPGWIGYIEK